MKVIKYSITDRSHNISSTTGLLNIVGFLMLMLSVQTHAVMLVDSGIPKAVIVISDHPGPRVAESARQLQNYLNRMSGGELPILKESEFEKGPCILLGMSRTVRKLNVDIPSGITRFLNEEGFVIKTVDHQTLVIAGNEDGPYKGTFFAVWEFLETIGCRWFFPGEFGEVIPLMNTIDIEDLDIRQTPDFRLRNIWCSGQMPIDNELNEYFHAWCDRNKIDNFHHLNLPYDGSTMKLVPKEIYFESNPECFALDDKGERIPDVLCTSEPNTIKIAVETIKNYFRTNPHAFSFGFAPSDGFPRCHCRECRKQLSGFEIQTAYGSANLSTSESWFLFVNKIANEVSKEFPDKWLVTNGYANRANPPERLILHPMIGVQVAMDACPFHRIGENRCWERQLYGQIVNRWTDRLDWVFIYDYEPCKALDVMPSPTMHCLEDDMRFYHRRGVWGFWTEANYAWMVTHLNLYIRSKLMWDVNSDVQILVKDYTQKFFLESAEPMERYIWTLENAVDKSNVHTGFSRIMFWRPILDPVETQLTQLIESAMARAETETVKKRMDVFYKTHQHMIAGLRMERAIADGRYAEAVSLADKMLSIKQEVENVQRGLLPPTIEPTKSVWCSLERRQKICRDMAERMDGRRGKQVLVLPLIWQFRIDPYQKGVHFEWYLPDNPSGPWQPIDVSYPWELQGHADEQGHGYVGNAWYRCFFELPDLCQDNRIVLTLPGIFHRPLNERGIGVWLWVNGTLQEWQNTHSSAHDPIEFDITESLKPDSKNCIALRVHSAPPHWHLKSGLYRRPFLWSPNDQ